ncbi:excinuclease ABC subunit UvrB [Halosquirtibacter laminarini]|uniref:Excinuclease ABC subunit UvrB n=1 Tax=Halosquirtibacter laminarini TaxID=3374600 RepID=A0AC61NCE7_9BACT|nr:excinuclease ABC subunit UvrB [Prolixibacteraceae bacterium]
MEFNIVSEFAPMGDQPAAIDALSQGVEEGVVHQTLLGVTGSGKTFTMANVIERTQKPTLILSHNKTLAAQLYAEMKQFFPNNSVEYFVSYYDYYQPEAYLPTTDTYIEKDLSINQEIEKLRLSATSALLSGRSDVIVVSSVSCLYGIGNPADFHDNVTEVKVGDTISRNALLRSLVDAMYSRSEVEFERGNFRVKGDTIDIYPAYADYAYRICFWGDEIDELFSIDPLTAKVVDKMEEMVIFPATIFVTTQERTQRSIREIQDDLVKQIAYFEREGKPVEAKRIKDRTEYDLEMMRELGYCPGVENYSRYFDGREVNSRPFCLLDYFPKDYLMIVDESHVTIPQIRAMYGGDRSRKTSLVEYGFRLPAALDNRPLKFEEFEDIINQILYVSATPADYELEKSEGVIVEQVIRPTGLLDPIIEVRPVTNQVDDLIEEIYKVKAKGERILVTTLTKRMAEELTKYLVDLGISTAYIHSDVDTLERIEIMEALRAGLYDVLVGINLLREGLDLPEVSLVTILDADKEGFLRSERSLTQTAGRAARNVNGRVIMYADKITRSMQKTIDATESRRVKQSKFNQDNGLEPMPIVKASREIVGQSQKLADSKRFDPTKHLVAEKSVSYAKSNDLEKEIIKMEYKMKEAAKNLDFLEAARLRDILFELKKQNT